MTIHPDLVLLTDFISPDSNQLGSCFGSSLTVSRTLPGYLVFVRSFLYPLRVFWYAARGGQTYPNVTPLRYG